MRVFHPVSCLIWLLCFVMPVSAQESFGLLKVLEGNVSVDHQPVKQAVLVKPGQRLIVSESGKARISLLGKSRETVISGPIDTVLNPSEISSKAVVVKRDQVRVSESLGPRNPKAGIVTRMNNPAQVFLSPELPPHLSQDSPELYEVTFRLRGPKTSPLFSQGASLHIEVVDLLEPQSQLFQTTFPPESAESNIKAEIPTHVTIGVPLKIGRDYLFTVTAFKDDDMHNSSSLRFRLPTPDEAALLTKMEKRAKRRRNNPSALMELAEVALELGQPNLAFSALRQLKDMRLSVEMTPLIHQNYDLLHRAIEISLP